MKRFVSIGIVLLMIAAVPFSVLDAAKADGSVLVDYGNGSYEWYSPSSGGSCLDILSSCTDDVIYENGSLTIGGYGRISIGDVVTDWKIYSWNDDGWKFVTADPTETVSGTIAFGLFSDIGFTPSATPAEPTVWTQFGGSSSSYNVSSSYGPTSPALPVEWYNTYTTGYVDSGLVVAGDLLYHTTGGTYGGRGDDNDPWVYCLNRDTGKIVWKYHASYGAGYEVTTPIVIGGLLAVTTTNGDLFIFDRFTGDVLDRIDIPFQPPIDGNGDIIWDGRTFVTGGTTPVYDSGCIFFGSADGMIYCYTVSPAGKLTQVWVYDPPATGSKGDYTGTKGSFYYHAPLVASIGGKRMLFLGSYEGYLHALDITTGEAVWVERLIDMRGDNRCVPGTPGSVASLSMSPDGTVLLATCTDGGLFTLDGYLLGIDPATGSVLKRVDGSDWMIVGLFTAPASSSEGFYTYASPTGSSTSLSSVNGGTTDFTDAVYMFDWNGAVVWKSGDYQMIKAPLTLADGVLYAMDYSAGVFWPSGGALTAISAADGHELWRVRLSPYSADSYSMVQPTVIDGRIYAANDFGAVYCLSAVAGAGTEEDRIEALYTAGFHHWSWAAVAVAMSLSVLFLARVLRY